jgi:hypothetical protein
MLAAEFLIIIIFIGVRALLGVVDIGSFVGAAANLNQRQP